MPIANKPAVLHRPSESTWSNYQYQLEKLRICSCNSIQSLGMTIQIHGKPSIYQRTSELKWFSDWIKIHFQSTPLVLFQHFVWIQVAKQHNPLKKTLINVEDFNWQTTCLFFFFIWSRMRICSCRAACKHLAEIFWASGPASARIRYRAPSEEEPNWLR